LPGGSESHAYAVADVTRASQVRAAVDDVSDRVGAPSALINAAGILRSTRFLDISEAEWDAVMSVSVKGTFLACQACIPMMRRSAHGRIVIFSSTAGKSVSTLGGAHYTTAKTALLGLTRALAAETAADGITVNAVCPGLFDTDMVRQTIDPVTLDGYARSFPIGRLGQPWEVAALVGYLCSPQAAYITGAALDINGGDLMV
jgi:NAD(P)-dependent dehydrogenase (short-subunit alcohol dehydrogenase family)